MTVSTGADYLSKWDVRFLELAEFVGRWSKDNSTRVGAVIVDRERRIVSVGFNGFARGCSDAPELYADREVKLRRVVHAEVNAVLFAGRSVRGCTIYTTPFPPCAKCAAMLIQAGIARVVAPAPTPDLKARWGADLEEAARMFAEAEVAFVQVEAAGA
jgi:dCMP deaminase